MLPPPSTLSFTLSTPISPGTRFGPRIGNLCLQRPRTGHGSELQVNASDTDMVLNIDTPGLLVPSSRGIVPHLSRDHCRATNAIRLVNVPFEMFLEHLPPIPTLQPGNHEHPLHKFLGFLPSQHVLSMSARNPHDGKEMPPNGNTHVSVSTLRGVRKMTPVDWRTYTYQCKPDIVFALSDMPFTNPPYSQKRLTKSIDRSVAWLAHLLQPQASPLTTTTDTCFLSSTVCAVNATQQIDYRPNIFVHLAGCTSLPARRAFSDSLMETLYGKEAEMVKPLHCLDDGVDGYVFDLVPLRTGLGSAKPMQSENDQKPAKQPPNSNPDPIPSIDGDPNPKDHVISMGTSTSSLLQASLSPLPPTKPRLVNSARSPHEILRLIRDVGIDVFDAQWALDGANIGVALDFVFPIPVQDTVHDGRIRNGRRSLGHNLYEKKYEFDFGSLAGSMRGALSDRDADVDHPVCPCAACSPVRPRVKDHIVHSPSDVVMEIEGELERDHNPPYTRAYIHHLLHTHEMAAHTWLVMHNLAVLDAFLGGVRQVLRDEGEGFVREVARFEGIYEEGEGEGSLFWEAKRCWREVDLARGKGRLERENKKAKSEALSNTSVKQGT